MKPETADSQRAHATAEELRRTIAELVQERRRSRRQRLWNLILLGIAISLPFHIAIIAYLASVRTAGPTASAQEEILIDFSVLSEAELDEIGETLEIESLDAPEVEEETVFSEMLSDELEMVSAASVTNLDLTGAVPAPGGGAGLGNSDAVGGGHGGGRLLLRGELTRPTVRLHRGYLGFDE